MNPWRTLKRIFGFHSPPRAPTAEEHLAALEAVLAREFRREGLSEAKTDDRVQEYRVDFEDSVRARVKRDASEPEVTREVLQHRDRPDAVATGIYRVRDVCIDLCMLNPWLFGLVGWVLVVLLRARWNGPDLLGLLDVLLFAWTGVLQSLLVLALSRWGHTWTPFLLPDEEGHRYARATTQIIRLFLALMVYVVLSLLLHGVLTVICAGPPRLYLSIIKPPLVDLRPDGGGPGPWVGRSELIAFSTLAPYYLLGLLMPFLVAAAMAASGVGKLLIWLLGKVKHMLRHRVAD